MIITVFPYYVTRKRLVFCNANSLSALQANVACNAERESEDQSMQTTSPKTNFVKAAISWGIIMISHGECTPHITELILSVSLSYNVNRL